MDIHEIVKQGYGGVLPTGEIVDRREHPNAMPMQRSSALDIPEPQPLHGPGVELMTPTRDDIVNAFAVEPQHDRATLERYLREYPQHAEDLVDLSYELNRIEHTVEEDAPLSPEDVARIDAAWRKHIGEEVKGNG